MRFRKDYFIRNVWILLLFLYENFNVFLFHPDNYHGCDFCQVFLWKVYGSGIVDREHTQTMVIISGLLFVVVCNFLYANFFYKDLHVSSIYIFTRNNNRFKWLINRSLELAVYVFISVSIYVGAAFVSAGYLSQKSFQTSDAIFCITVFLAMYLYCYFTCYVINVVSVYWGSGYAFFSMMILQAVMAELAINHEKIPVLKDMPWLLKLNPVANIICSWKISGALHLLVYFGGLSIGVFVICYLTIRNRDMGLDNKEM